MIQKSDDQSNGMQTERSLHNEHLHMDFWNTGILYFRRFLHFHKFSSRIEDDNGLVITVGIRLWNRSQESKQERLRIQLEDTRRRSRTSPASPRSCHRPAFSDPERRRPWTSGRTRIASALPCAPTCSRYESGLLGRCSRPRSCLPTMAPDTGSPWSPHRAGRFCRSWTDPGGRERRMVWGDESVIDQLWVGYESIIVVNSVDREGDQKRS